MERAVIHHLLEPSEFDEGPRHPQRPPPAALEPHIQNFGEDILRVVREAQATSVDS